MMFTSCFYVSQHLLQHIALRYVYFLYITNYSANWHLKQISIFPLPHNWNHVHICVYVIRCSTSKGGWYNTHFTTQYIFSSNDFQWRIMTMRSIIFWVLNVKNHACKLFIVLFSVDFFRTKLLSVLWIR